MSVCTGIWLLVSVVTLGLTLSGWKFNIQEKPSRFIHFWQDRQSLAPATQSDIWTFKCAPYPSVFCTFDLEMCFAPQRRAAFEQRNFPKCSETAVFCTFCLGNMLRAPTACNFWSLIWPDGSALAALASLLFDPLEPQISGKHSVSRLFYPFARLHSFFSLFLFSALLLLFSLLTLITSAFPLSILSEVWLPNFLRQSPNLKSIRKVAKGISAKRDQAPITPFIYMGVVQRLGKTAILERLKWVTIKDNFSWAGGFLSYSNCKANWQALNI